MAYKTHKTQQPPWLRKITISQLAWLRKFEVKKEHWNYKTTENINY